MNIQLKKGIVGGNKLIAEFMGYRVFHKRYPRNHGIGAPEVMEYMKDIIIEKAKYHSSWDWLMPVIEKIGEIQNQADIEFSIELCKFDKGVTIFSVSIFVPISLVYNCVVEFIKWYNQKQKE